MSDRTKVMLEGVEISATLLAEALNDEFYALPDISYIPEIVYDSTSPEEERCDAVVQALVAMGATIVADLDTTSFEED